MRPQCPRNFQTGHAARRQQLQPQPSPGPCATCPTVPALTRPPRPGSPSSPSIFSWTAASRLRSCRPPLARCLVAKRRAWDYNRYECYLRFWGVPGGELAAVLQEAFPGGPDSPALPAASHASTGGRELAVPCPEAIAPSPCSTRITGYAARAVAMQQDNSASHVGCGCHTCRYLPVGQCTGPLGGHRVPGGFSQQLGVMQFL